MADHFLVFGGTKGAGRAFADRISSEPGKTVSVFGRTADVSQSSDSICYYDVDLSDADAARHAASSAVTRFGRIVSAVFFQRHRGKDLQADVATAVTATHHLIDHLVDNGAFADAPSRSVVVVGSIADTFVAPEQPAGYHVAKAGLTQLARYYAVMLGPQGIRVNCVAPCVVAKPTNEAFFRDNVELATELRRLIPLGRMGTYDDVIDAVLFLAGPTASYVTGQTLIVDGGLTLRSHESLIRDVVGARAT